MRIDMNLRARFNIFLTLLSIVSLVSLVLTVYVLVIQGFKKVEWASVETNVERMNEASQSEILGLDAKMVDWAWWDDTYQYMQNKNEAYVESNLQVTTLEGLDLRGIVFVDNEGKLVREFGYTGDLTRFDPLPGPVIKKLLENGFLKFVDSKELKAGLLEIGGKYYIFAARPILTSLREGPPVGFIVFVRSFDEKIVEKIAKAIKLNVKFLPKERQKRGVELVDKNTAHGYVELTDVSGKQVGVLQFTQPRAIYIQGISSLKVISTALIGLTLLAIVLSYVMLNYWILIRLARLSKEVREIGQGNLALTTTDLAKDELSSLSDNINQMILMLRSSKELLKSSKESVRAYVDIVGVMVVVIAKDERIVLLNKKAGEILGVHPEEVVGKNWFDVCIQESDRSKVKKIFDSWILGGKGVEYHENWVVTKSGEKRLIAWHNALITDEKGQIVSTLSAGEDVTDRKKSDEEKEKHVKELERLNELMMGRELKMIELKKQIEQYKKV